MGIGLDKCWANVVFSDNGRWVYLLQRNAYCSLSAYQLLGKGDEKPPSHALCGNTPTTIKQPYDFLARKRRGNMPTRTPPPLFCG